MCVPSVTALSAMVLDVTASVAIFSEVIEALSSFAVVTAKLARVFVDSPAAAILAAVI